MPLLKSSFNTKGVEAGCDEAGRGCLAGPVVAAAVILPPRCKIKGLDDSKKLSEKQREALAPIIRKKALFFAVGLCSPAEIDQINILNASFLAMHKALDQIQTKIDLILVDGNRFKKYKEFPHTCIVEGDGKYLSIAAASVLAKTHRDAIMKELHETFPEYNWAKNKGYGTLEHRRGIEAHGPCIHHRKSFTLLSPQLELFPEE
jgi:ribonuclease HII